MICYIFKVKLTPQPAYEFPPLLLCPGPWYDAGKARKLEFTEDAVRYSMGYFSDIEGIRIENLTKAKREFLEAFERGGFSSLVDYVDAISVDIEIATDLYPGYMQSTKPTAWCSECNQMDKENLRKIFFDFGICYVVDFKPQDASPTRTASPNRGHTLIFKTSDMSGGMITGYSTLWRLFHITDSRLTVRTGRVALHLATYSLHYIKVSESRYAMLGCEESPCLKKEDMEKNYSRDTCFAACAYEVSDKVIGCHWLFEEPISPKVQPGQPANYCNAFTHTEAMYAVTERPEYLEELQKCSQKCPVECDRIVYEISVAGTLDEANARAGVRAVSQADMAQNMSMLAIDVIHQGYTQGGIVIFTEVNTITVYGLISNLGGALGLFVGGTLMTFVQVILFGAKRFMDWKGKVKIDPVMELA